MKRYLNTALILALALCLGALINRALADGAPNLTVNTLTTEYNEKVLVIVQAPLSATAVRVWNDGDGSDGGGNRWGRWEYHDRNQNLRWLQTGIMCWDAGPWLVKAACTDADYENWDEMTALPDSAWTAVSQNITLTVSDMLGFINPPEAALYFSSANALSFEQITFWAWAEGADRIHITVTRDDQPNWRNDFDRDGDLHQFDWSSSYSGVRVFTLTAFYGGDVTVYGAAESPLENAVKGCENVSFICVED